GGCSRTVRFLGGILPHSALAKPASRAAFCRTPISRFLDKSAKSWIGRLNDPAVPEPPGGRGRGRKRGQTYFSDLFSGPATREARALHRRGKISLSRKKRSPPGKSRRGREVFRCPVCVARSRLGLRSEAPED